MVMVSMVMAEEELISDGDIKMRRMTMMTIDMDESKSKDSGFSESKSELTK